MLSQALCATAITATIPRAIPIARRDDVFDTWTAEFSRRSARYVRLRALNPTMSVKSAREFIERRSGATYDALRGATYRSR